MRDYASTLSFPLLLLLLATLLLGAEVVRRRYRSALGNLFLAMLVSLGIWNTGHFFELLLAGRPVAEFWGTIKYLGVGPLPPIALALALVFTGRQRWLRSWLIVLLAASALLGFAGAATDDIHHRFFGVDRDWYSSDRWLFWILIALSWVDVLVASGLVIHHGFKTTAEQRRNSFLLAGSFLIPLAGNALDALGLFSPLDVAVVFMAGSVTLLAFSVFRYRLLDVAEVARRGVVDTMEYGVLIFDLEGRAVDSNVAAARMLGASSPEHVVGRHYADLIARAKGAIHLMATNVEVGEIMSGGAPQNQQFQLVSASPGREAVNVQIYPLLSEGGEPLGRVMLLRDVTTHSQLVENLAQSGAQIKAQQEALESANLRLLQKNLELTQAREELAALNRQLEGRIHLATEELERRRREAEEGRERVQAIVDQLPEGLIVLEGTDARVALANAAARELWPAVLELGRPLPSPPVAYGRQRGEEAIDEVLRAVLQHRRAIAGVRTSVFTAAVGQRRLLLNATPLAQPEGATAAVLVFQDITSLVESQEVKEEFLSIATHELRAPLTVIRGYVQALLHDSAADPDSELARSLRSIERQGNRMFGLISELLDASRIEIGGLTVKPEPTLVIGFLRRLFHEAQLAHPTHAITFTWERGMEQMAALWDLARVEQVVANLTQNAVKYSPDGSEVRGSARATEGFVEVSIHDQGPGIPPPAQRLVFERYYQVAEEGDRRSGLGLGLYISREIIRAHGGRMWVVSEPGQGSTFHFTLPLPPPDEEEG